MPKRRKNIVQTITKLKIAGIDYMSALIAIFNPSFREINPNELGNRKDYLEVGEL
jgi:hypothetical protein